MQKPWLLQQAESPLEPPPGKPFASKNAKPESDQSLEGWEQCLREQITMHPRIALGMGLLTGLLAGWWVKR